MRTKGKHKTHITCGDIGIVRGGNSGLAIKARGGGTNDAIFNVLYSIENDVFSSIKCQPLSDISHLSVTEPVQSCIILKGFHRRYTILNQSISLADKKYELR